LIDTISREDAIAVIRKNHYRLQGKGMTEEVLIADLEALPSAEPKTGKWICESTYNIAANSVWNETWNKWKCDQCGDVIKKGWSTSKEGQRPTFDFCPNCGSYNGGEKWMI